MKTKRQYRFPTEREAVTAGYITVVVAGVLYLKNEGYLGPLDVIGILIVLGAAVVSAIGSLIFSRATTLKDRARAAARIAGWGAFIAGLCVLLAYLAVATFIGLMWAWHERHQ